MCGICNSNPDQLSHHKSHLGTQKHIDKSLIFKLTLQQLNKDELVSKYKTNDIDIIIQETDTIIYNKMVHNIDDVNGTNIIDNQNMINQSDGITNKDALRDKVHEIHNFLRNNGAGYGMNALKVFNIFYGLKKIEEYNLLDKVNLSSECRFSYLLNLANQDKDEELKSVIINNVLDSIHNDNTLKKILFYEIPKKIKGDVFVYLIKEINNITCIEQTCNVQLSGKIYEYFIGRDESAISELGAYFTDRHIVDFIYNKLNPTINEEDNSINSMIDMFGGSGGFTTGYVNYLNKTYPDVIDWNNEINNIYHYDMNDDVIKSAGLELFCLTGVLPNPDNLSYSNSFNFEFGDKQFKTVITNPPYGGDKNKQSAKQLKQLKIKNYIKNELLTIIDDGVRIQRQQQLKNIEKQDKQDKKDSDSRKVNLKSSSNRINKFAKKYNLKANDKEAVSLILIMDLLEINGTAIGVLKEGIFFNKTYKELRKCLIENFNVREVISVPSDQFENTSTKTSIIIFDNTEIKTTNIKFSNLIVNRYTEDKFIEINNEIFIKENKDDIKEVTDELISEATKEELLSNSIYSLNGKDYNKKEIKVGEGYELKKLGDICEFMPKSSRKASFGSSEGLYNFYTSSDKVKYCNIMDYNEQCLIIGNGGIANIQLDCNFSCSDHNIILKSLYNQYIYYLLIGNMNLLIDGFTGSVLKNLSKDYIKNLQIPVPKSEEKITEWVTKISTPYDKMNHKQKQLKELEEEIQNRIKEITENEECEEVKLGDLIDTHSGDYIIKSNMVSGIYPVYGGGNISNYINIYNRENELIINKDGVSLDCVKFESNKFFLNHHGWTLTHKNINNKIYINYWLLNNQQQIYNCATGSAQKGINKNTFLKIKIKIPKNKQLITDLESKFNKIELLNTKIKKYEQQYKQYIKELSQEAIIDEFNEQQLSNEFNKIDLNESQSKSIENLSLKTIRVKKI